MTKSRAVLVFLVVAMLLCAYTAPPAGSKTEAARAIQSPAAVETIKVLFVNKTGVTIPILAFKGSTTYYFYNVPVGQNFFYMPQGKYLVVYPACGRERLKLFTVKAGVKISTVKCRIAKLTIQNTTLNTIYLYMNGPARYIFILPPGNTQLTIIAGNYQYTGFGVCVYEKGSKKVKAKTTWSWKCN